MKRAHFLAIQLLVSLTTVSLRAEACPEGQYQGPLGWCYPEIGGAVGDSFEHLKREIPAQIAGNPLEGWIVASRNTSINGAQPIPWSIRQQLTGYINDATMNIAVFKIGDPGVLNLAGLTMQYGDVSAITLIDVIVFRSAADAYNNAALWAHELTHVAQYRDWGVHNFAISYVRNVSDVENPAYAIGNGFAQWSANNLRGAAPQTVQQVPFAAGALQQGLPRGFVVQGCGCWGPTTGFNPNSACQSGGNQAVTCSSTCSGGGWQYAWVCQ
jgi:uncharacterized protein DUF4157